MSFWQFLSQLQFRGYVSHLFWLVTCLSWIPTLIHPYFRGHQPPPPTGLSSGFCPVLGTAMPRT